MILLTFHSSALKTDKLYHTHGSTVDPEEEKFDYEWRRTWDVVEFSLLGRYSPRRTEKIYRRLPDVSASCTGILCTESKCYILLRS